MHLADHASSLQVRHHCPDDLSLRKELIARLAERVRFALMEAEALHDTVLGAPEADSEAVRAMVQEGLWFKCFSFERQQERIQVRQGQGEGEKVFVCLVPLKQLYARCMGVRACVRVRACVC